MKILYLGPHSPLIEYVESQGNTVVHREDKMTIQIVKELKPDFLVSYNYRFILKKDVLDLFSPNRAINLHISYLPWNRGADPNLWSFLEDTPKGVTIHYLDEDVDTGDIIIQKEVNFDNNATLKSTHGQLQKEIQDLFKINWQSISTGTCSRQRQDSNGTIHFVKDKDSLTYLIKNGWDTSVSDIHYAHPFPQIIRIEPAASCNFKCIHCPTGLDMSPTGVMTIETFNQITENLEKIVTQQGHPLQVIVLYHGGEPLLNKHFFEMVRRAKTLAKVVKTVTNGSRLNNETVKQIVDSELDLIEISLDGVSAEENDKIRRNPIGATFESVSKQVIALIQRKREQEKQLPKVSISNTQIPETIEQVVDNPQPPQYMLEAFKEVAGEINYNCNWALVWPGMPLRIQDKPEHNHCDHVISTMSIRSNGDVVPCCYDLVSKMPMGNATQQRIEEIWNNKRYRGIRKAIKEFKPPGLCKNCPVLYKFQPMVKSDIFPKK